MKRQHFFIIGAVLATLFIFFNSFQSSGISDASSDVFIDVIMDTARDSGHQLRRIYVGRTIRKTAHILEFALQGFMLCGCFLMPFKSRIIYVLFAGLMTGCIDEFIQIFPEGRTSLVQDIFFDFAGTVIGVLLFALAIKLRKKYRKD